MAATNFDLIDIVRGIAKRKTFVLGFTFLCGIFGLIFSLVTPKEYTSRTSSIVKSPMLADRNQQLRQNFFQNKAFFASEDEIDNVITVSKSDTLFQYLVDRFNLKETYKTDSRDVAIEKAKKSFKFKRNDTKNVEVYFSAHDPELAKQLANAATQKIGEMLSHYFLSINQDVVAALNGRIASINDTIARLESEMDSLRNGHNLYSQLLPSRSPQAGVIKEAGTNMSSSAVRALEQLQSLAVLKDKMVTDRANFYSLINEYSVGEYNQGFNMLHVVQAGLYGSETWPIWWIVTPICLLAGLLFACILVTFTEYYRSRVQTA
jgi:uncharacterized protein involved in exopolysaccharide biosynthesis